MLFTRDNLEKYFKDEISRVSQAEIDVIDAEINEIRQKTLANLEQDVKKETDYACTQKINELKSEEAIRVNQLEEKTNHELIVLRKKLMDELFDEVKQKLADYKNSKEYLVWLKKKVNAFDTYNLASYTMYISESDKKYVDDLKKTSKGNCMVSLDGDIEIGGIRFESEEAGIVVDDTFDSILDEQRAWFHANSGLFVK